MRLTQRLIAVLALLICCATACLGADSLEAAFRTPPPSARPWAYWFWLNGNITREGITADLEAMARVGIGGVLIMEVDVGTPVGPVDFMGDKWRELFHHVVTEAHRLGLEVNMNNDAGWNGSGGPWVKPEESMKKVVSTEVDVTGPRRYEATLAQPFVDRDFYRELAVLAFPTVGSYRIPGIETKAAYAMGARSPVSQDTPPPEMVVASDRIIDISDRMDAAGKLTWDVPEGNWTIMRFGYTSTGATNGPSPATGFGLEPDKLSKEGADASFRGMIAKLAADSGPLVGKSFVATHVDSWENGSQNWTGRMREEFIARRGYDPTPYLPVMTGRVIGSLEISERFLWDLRRTISELCVENYAGHIRELAHKTGLRFTIEAYGGPCDSMPYAAQCDEPMGEFWTPNGYFAESCKTMSSAAHAYAKPIVGAEAFTSGDGERWREHPAVLKAFGDRAFCDGINRFVFHRFAMQPWVPERDPGMTMGPYGQHYERTQTWWNQSAGWHTYLSRCQYMLRQGRFVADICYLRPENSPLDWIDHARAGYDWDECGSEIVLDLMSVKDGRIVLPSGMSYRVMVLPNTPTMTPRLLGKIKDMVQAGATVIGSKPSASPSLSDYPRCDQEIRRLAGELWGDCDGVKVKEHRFGKGRVVCGATPEAVLEASGVRPDFAGVQPIRFIHRVSGGTDIYFVSNQQPRDAAAAATFRVTGKVPELWWPDTGRIERAPVYEQKDGVTNVSLPLGPSGSVFVVFRLKASGSGITAVKRDGSTVFSTTPEARATIDVKSAVYGIPGDPVRTRDVRDRVRAKLCAGEHSFPVSSMAAGDDPAPEIVKTLTVDYTVNGRSFTVSASDSEQIRITDQAVKINVGKALYGILGDPSRTRDRREMVQRMVDAGKSSFMVADLASGDDPAYRVVKTLKLEYTMNGQRRELSATDPEIVDLATVSGGPAPPCEVHCDSKGMRLIAWESGKYTLVRANGKSVEVDAAPAALPIEGPWKLAFPPNSGAPASVALDRLVSWPMFPDDGVKYFSGTATYHTTFTAPRDLLAAGRRVRLDLGEVQVIAQVKLNGKDVGILWKPPFFADVTGFVKPGENELEVKVTNLWPNRMIGDEFLPEDSDRNENGTLKSWPQWLAEGKPSPTGRHTFTSWRLWRKDDVLLPSGLIGPVTLRSATETVVR